MSPVPNSAFFIFYFSLFISDPLARELLFVNLTMENRLTDNITGFLREVAARVARVDDTTEVEEILRESADHLRERINEERLEAAGRLAGWLAHKINNPLGAISGNAQLLGRRLQRDIGEGDALDTYMKYVDGVESQTQRCAKITSDLLAFTRPRDLDVRSVDINEVITEAVDLAKYGRNSAIVNISAAITPRIQTDRELLVKVLYEVIVNAVTVSENGPVEVKTDSDRDGWVRVAVTDSGPGIPVEAARRIFDPFFSTREKAKGLGLTTALSIMSQLGGSIEVAKTGPEGTVFVMGLPVERQ